MISMKKMKIFKFIDVSVLVAFVITFLTSCETLTEPEPPDPVTIIEPEEISSSSLKLNWTQSTDSDFSKYKIYRSSSYSVSENSTLITTIYPKYETSYKVTGLNANTTYYFKVYVYNNDGLSAGSNTLSVTTAKLIEVEEYKTNYQGIASFEIGGYNVEVETKDESNNSLSNIEINAAVTENYLIVVANPPSQYYPDIKIRPLSNNISKETNISDINEQESVIAITFALIGVGLWLKEMITDPPYIEGIIDENGVSKKCVTGDLNDLISTISLISGGFGKIFHIGSTVASKLGISAKTAVMTSEAIDGGVDLFTALMGETFGIFDKDILKVCWGVDDNDNPITPLYCEDIELHRDFVIRLTLTWGENPRDLDSHLWTPSISGSSYHVYYEDKGSTDYLPYAELDVDDIQSYGPENITIKQLFPGTYYYSIHHYDIWEDDIGNITSSGASVKIFGTQGEIYNLNVPYGYSESGWWWNVLQINGSTSQISIINEISSSPPSGTLAKVVNWNHPKE